MIITSVALPSSSASLGIGAALVDALDNSIRADLQQFSQELYFWVLVSAGAVIVGVVIEGPEILFELKPHWFSWFTRKSSERLQKFERRLKIAGFIGWVLVAVGVAGEGIFEGLQNRAEGQLQTFNNIILTDARLTAGRARDSAVLAGKAARDAKESSDAAVLTASSASKAAGGARKEADSFERDIVSAKQQAADAVSRLADAEQRLAGATLREAAAEARLAAIKTPRSLVNANELIAFLKRFRGTEYTFNVSEDDESIEFTKRLDSALRQAGWIRKQPGVLHIGITALNVFSTDRKDLVEICIATGVLITLHSESPGTLVRLDPALLSGDAQAAVSLRSQLASHIAPTEEHNVASNVTVDPVAGKAPMLTCVGRKP